MDTNYDGRPDYRYGVDNACCDTTDHRLRMWRTDLALGTTIANIRSLEDPLVMDATIPGSNGDMDGHIWAHLAGDDIRFYVWASAIVDGQIVGTDFAPDVGWIQG